MHKYRYTWKSGIGYWSNREIGFEQPLLPGVLFADLLTGEVYSVSSVHKAQQHDRLHSTMPEDVVQTFFSRLLSRSELAAVQTEHDFRPSESVLRGEAFAILDLGRIEEKTRT